MSFPLRPSAEIDIDMGTPGIVVSKVNTHGFCRVQVGICEGQSMMTKQEGLKKLAESEGMEELLDMLEKATFNGIAPGICLECGHTDETEPDQTQGYCGGCGKQTIQSCLILAGIL